MSCEKTEKIQAPANLSFQIDALQILPELLPFKDSLKKLLEHLKHMRAMQKEPEILQNWFLPFLYLCQKEAIKDTEGLAILSFLANKQLCQPLYNAIEIENAQKDLCKYTTGAQLLFFSRKNEPCIRMDLEGIKKSTNKPCLFALHAIQLTAILKTDPEFLSRADKILLLGEIPKSFQHHDLHEIFIPENSQDALQKILRTRKPNYAHNSHETKNYGYTYNHLWFLPDCEEYQKKIINQTFIQSGFKGKIHDSFYLKNFNPRIFTFCVDGFNNLPFFILQILYLFHASWTRILHKLDAFPDSTQKIPITLYNWHSLSEEILTKTKIKIEDFSALNSPFSLRDDFMEFLFKIHKKTGVSFIMKNPEVIETFDILDQAKEKFSDEVSESENLFIYLMRLLGVLSEKTFVGPHTVHIDITSRCNTKCTFCGYHTPLISERPWAANGWDQLSLDFTLFQAMIEDLSRIHTTEDILLTGGGEPLLHPKILDMISLIKEKKMGMILFTNGLLLKEDTARFLVDHALDKIYWSIHSASPATWLIQHPGSNENTFPMVISQMKNLLKYRNSKKSKKPVIVFVNVLSSVNVHEIHDMVTLAIELGIDEIRFQVMHYGNEQTDHMMLTNAQLEWLYQQLPEIEKKLFQANIHLLDNFSFQVKELRDFTKKGEKVKSCDWALNLFNQTGCFTGWFFSRTWVDGRMSFCCHDRLSGDLKKGGFAKNWFSKEYENYRKIAKHFDEEKNIYMADSHKGGWLLAEDCSWCGNYEFMIRASKTLQRMGLVPFLKISTRQAREKQNILLGKNSFKPEVLMKFPTI